MPDFKADCLFCKIAAGQIKADIVYQDDRTVAFNDINPQAPVHVLVIPKDHYATLDDVTDRSIYRELFDTAAKVVELKKLSADGYRVVANCKENGGQAVAHIHLHILGGRPMKWPPG
ncbi:MAG: histidine triad nucleotide-binding protein [Spirochaetes bacterium GWF1_51_8]|nr:MAG: histidine triad nucleotide-binding protein [Spirochaetes bacterium GWF1_51_8]